jgi:hypothetical protein
MYYCIQTNLFSLQAVIGVFGFGGVSFSSFTYHSGLRKLNCQTRDKLRVFFYTSVALIPGDACPPRIIGPSHQAINIKQAGR